MSYEYATKICPVYSPMEPTDVRSLLEYVNAFNPGPAAIVARELIVARYHGLPAAVMAHYEAKYGRTGKSCIKKMRQMMTVAPITGPTGKKITQKMGVRELLTDGVWYTLGKVKIKPIMAFNFGLVFAGHDTGEIIQAMKDASSWLPVMVGVETKIICS